MYSDFLEEINSKYSTIENELEQKIKLLLQEEQRENEATSKKELLSHYTQKTCPSLVEAKKRNSDMIKTLEMAKARLRSRSTYSPIESILEKALKNYCQALNLPAKATHPNDFVSI